MASSDNEHDAPRSEDARARSRRRGKRHESRDDDAGPDAADLAPDDLDTLACPECGKFILEGTLRCPYCKHVQLQEPEAHKSLWFILTVLICTLLIGGYFILGALGIVAKLHR